MHIVKIMGGLGNQLFQYAFAYELIQTGVDLRLDLIFYYEDNNGATPRELFYTLYGLNLPVASSAELEKAYDTSRDIWDRIRRRLKTYLNIRIGYPVFTDNDIRGKSDIPYKIRNCIYAGYWQNPMFFSERKEQIADIWRAMIPDLEERDRHLLNSFDGNMVSVHVRGTDYLNSANYQRLGSVCSRNYYKKAMEIIEDRIPHPVYIVFSDDFEYVKEMLDVSGRDYIMVDWHGEEDTLKDFYLMSLCKHHIMANSSFGWWAVHLGKSDRGIVCCPLSWRGNDDSTELLEDDWIKI